MAVRGQWYCGMDDGVWLTRPDAAFGTDPRDAPEGKDGRRERIHSRFGTLDDSHKAFDIP